MHSDAMHSVLNYVINVTLHYLYYLMLYRFEIYSALEFSRTTLLGCCLTQPRVFSRLLVGNHWGHDLYRENKTYKLKKSIELWRRRKEREVSKNLLLV